MPQPMIPADRCLRRLWPLAMSVVLVVGCDDSASKTAAFPDTQKPSMKTEAPKTPAKGMDRTGSDGLKPM